MLIIIFVIQSDAKKPNITCTPKKCDNSLKESKGLEGKEQIINGVVKSCYCCRSRLDFGVESVCTLSLLGSVLGWEIMLRHQMYFLLMSQSSGSPLAWWVCWQQGAVDYMWPSDWLKQLHTGAFLFSYCSSKPSQIPGLLLQHKPAALISRNISVWLQWHFQLARPLRLAQSPGPSALVLGPSWRRAGIETCDSV